MAPAAVGKLTPTEAAALQQRGVPRTDQAASIREPEAAAAPSGAAVERRRGSKALQARLAERRKAAEPKANAATEALVRISRPYVAADGKGAAGDQFAGFAKWYADTKSAGRTVGEIKPAIEDYGDAKAGAAATAEVT